MSFQEALDGCINVLVLFLNLQPAPGRPRDARGEFSRYRAFAYEHKPLVVGFVLVEMHDDHVGALLFHPRSKGRYEGKRQAGIRVKHEDEPLISLSEAMTQ
ncbi:MAG TPA: hypothetical protein DEA05_07385 [Rhodobacteraceae bacterium]|nr:hypothetical protein [Paracoccaceae bacterium]